MARIEPVQVDDSQANVSEVLRSRTPSSNPILPPVQVPPKKKRRILPKNLSDVALDTIGKSTLAEWRQQSMYFDHDWEAAVKNGMQSVEFEAASSPTPATTTPEVQLSFIDEVGIHQTPGIESVADHIEQVRVVELEVFE